MAQHIRIITATCRYRANRLFEFIKYDNILGLVSISYKLSWAYFKLRKDFIVQNVWQIWLKYLAQSWQADQL